MKHPSMENMFGPAVVLIPTADGTQCVGGFPDLPAAWYWIEWFADGLPEGTSAVRVLDPQEGYDKLRDRGLI